MHDVELLLCTESPDPWIPHLLDQLADWERPREDREALVAELRAMVAAALTGERWTPYYDRGLRLIADATDDELLDPGWGYDPEPQPVEQFAPARKLLTTHAALTRRLQDAERCGARTLAAAFELLTISTDELTMWFGLCPDQAALDRRLRTAALAYLRATADRSPDLVLEELLLAAVASESPPDEIHELRVRWFVAQPSQERQCALGVAITEDQAASCDFTSVPFELIQLLGNPFDPRT